MYAKRMVMSSRLVVAFAIAGALITANAAAGGQAITVSERVSSKGLDLNRPADAQKFYYRLQNAARVLCTRGNLAHHTLREAAAHGIEVPAQVAAK